MLKRVTFGSAGPRPLPLPGQPHPAVAAELARLDLFRAGLAARTASYVAAGTGAEVLDAIKAADAGVAYHSSPFHRDSAGKTTVKRATDLAIATGEIAAGPAMARLLDVRASARLFDPSDGVAQMTSVQVRVQALFDAIRGGQAGVTVDYAVQWARLTNLAGLSALVACCGGTTTDLFGFLLTVPEAVFTPTGSWFDRGALTALMHAEPAALADALLALRPHQRDTAIKLIEHHAAAAAAPVVTALVAMLTRPFSKEDRGLAVSALARLEETVLAGTLARGLAEGDTDVRVGLVQAAGRHGGVVLRDQLATREAGEKASKVKAAIRAVLEAGEVGADAARDRASYTGIDGSIVPIPPAEPLAFTPPVLPEGTRAGFDAAVAEIAAYRAAQYPDQKPRAAHNQRPTPDDIEATWALMTAGVPLPGGVTSLLAHQVRHFGYGRAWFDALLDDMPPATGAHLLLGSGVGDLQHMLRGGYLNPAERMRVDRLRGWVEQGAFGLRELSAVPGMGERAPDAALRDLLTPPAYRYDNAPYHSPLADLPNEAVWPWLADQFAVFDEALGLAPAAGAPLSLERAMATLALLPAVPQRYLPALMDVALTAGKPLRRQAMALLRPVADLPARLEGLLDDGRQQVRANAATWLADIRATGSEAVLRRRLKREKSDPVRTALTEALQRLGADLSDVIGPASLIADAAKAKAAPALPDWLVAGLPVVHFRDGARVPDAVLRHWLALAIRLKEPGATGQFGITLDQLDPVDARALSHWVLDAWLTHDTRAASLDEANAFAAATYQQDWRWSLKTQTPELRAELIAEIARSRQGELLNSGTDTKGVLALACRADPAVAAAKVRAYLKAHGRRAHQAMALLDLLAGIGHPVTLQVVITASVRLKQKSTQAHAAAIAARHAEDRGWSVDELADRTVPTAGFDDDGTLALACGSGLYTAQLDATLAIRLFNPDGKPIKALPAGDDEATREARKALTAAKKELAQVVELQRARLFEAMCVERHWTVADWRTAFHEHPLMRRLVERLVWQGLDADGTPLALFRPTAEDDFTGADDTAVAIDGFALLRLAHGALVPDETGQAWRRHLADYEVEPSIAQFDAVRAALAPAEAEAEAITDRQGWAALSLSLRGVAEKRGYARVMGDGGGCHEWVKAFPSHGLTATIFHTGAHAQDENLPVALKELRFARERHRGALRLKEVQPVMLAECRSDYHAIAAVGTFDPDWEKISPW